MKVSEITTTNIASYLRLDDATDPILTSILTASKKYIMDYTGIKDGSVIDEEIGAGDGTATIYNVAETPIVPSSLTLKVDGVEKTLTTDYLVNETKGTITFVTAPTEGQVITASYTYGLDAYEDFYIVVMVLCQDMYDNRTMYVEKSNLNRVVSSILDMHCTNLLPTPLEIEVI